MVGGWFREIVRLPVTESINQRHIVTYSFCRSSLQNRYSQAVVREQPERPEGKRAVETSVSFCTKNCIVAFTIVESDDTNV